MSELFAGDARDELDRYYTPDPVAEAFCRWLRVPGGSRVVECSVGGGAWPRGLRQPQARPVHIVGVDIDPGAAGLALCDETFVGDWTTVGRLLDPADLVIGNPPYNDAAEHVRVALAAAPVVALLLRETFLQPVDYAHLRDADRRARMERRSLILDTPPALQWTWPERIRFSGGSGSDSVLHSLLIWVRGHRGPWQREIVRPDVPGWIPTSDPWGRR